MKPLESIFKYYTEKFNLNYEVPESYEDLRKVVMQSIDDLYNQIQEKDNELQEMAIDLQAQLEEISNLYEELSTLTKITNILNSTLYPLEIVENLLKELIEVTNCKKGMIYLFNKDKMELRANLGCSYQKLITEILEEIRPTESIFIDSTSKKYRKYYIILGRENILVVPVKSKGELLGYIILCDKKSGPIFTASDENLTSMIASELGKAVQNYYMLEEILKQKALNEQIKIARDIQSSLLPKTFPEFPHMDIYGDSIPAKTVGGDYFDFFILNKEKLGFIIADVSGKGVPASLIMATTRSLFRNYIDCKYESPKKLIETVNNTAAREFVEDRFVTLTFGEITIKNGRATVTISNAGHDPLMIMRNNGTIEEVTTKGIPLGIMEGMSFEETTFTLEKNEFLIGYTDGIPEARNINREEYGFERLKETIRKNKEKSASEIVKAVYENMFEYSSGAEQHDDSTIILLKVV